MSELISGKEALIALANGEEVDACVTHRPKKDEWHWFSAKNLTVNEIEAMETEGDPDGENIRAIAFRLKPRTIKLNGIEVPAPFKPKHGDEIWFLHPDYGCGYLDGDYDPAESYAQFGAWRTEEEIKQVVAALRSVFNEKTKEGDPS